MVFTAISEGVLSLSMYLATKINRSVNLDKVVFNASQMKDPQHKWRQALPVAVGAV